MPFQESFPDGQSAASKARWSPSISSPSQNARDDFSSFDSECGHVASGKIEKPALIRDATIPEKSCEHGQARGTFQRTPRVGRKCLVEFLGRPAHAQRSEERIVLIQFREKLGGLCFRIE